MLERRVAPPAIVVGQSEVGGAKVGCSDGDRAREAPPGVVVASHFETSSAAQPIVEQRGAQRRCVGSVPLAVQVPIPTRSSCKNPTPPLIKK